MESSKFKFKFVFIIFCTLIYMNYAFDEDGTIFSNMNLTCCESCYRLFPFNTFPSDLENVVSYIFHFRTFSDQTNNNYAKHYMNWLWHSVLPRTVILDSQIYSIDKFCKSYKDLSVVEKCKSDLKSRGFKTNLNNIDNFKTNIFRLFFEVSKFVIPERHGTIPQQEEKKQSSGEQSFENTQNHGKSEKPKVIDSPISILMEPPPGYPLMELNRKEGLADFTKDRLEKETPTDAKTASDPKPWKRREYKEFKAVKLSQNEFYEDYLSQAPYEVIISNKKIHGLYTPESFCEFKICEHFIISSLPACLECHSGTDYGKLIFLNININDVHEENTRRYINYLSRILATTTIDTITPNKFCENLDRIGVNNENNHSFQTANKNTPNEKGEKHICNFAKNALSNMLPKKKTSSQSFNSVAGTNNVNSVAKINRVYSVDNYPIHNKNTENFARNNCSTACLECKTHMMANFIVLNDIASNLKRLFLYYTRENTKIGPIDDGKPNYLFQYMEVLSEKLVFLGFNLLGPVNPTKYCIHTAKKKFK